MENDSTNILKGKEPRDIVATGESGERETNAPNQFKAPRAVEVRETNVTCQRKTAENTGAWEINVPEKGTAAVRRDGGPLTIADQQLRKGDSAASRPPSRTQEGAGAEAAPRTAGLDPGEGAKIGGVPTQHNRHLPRRNTSKPGQQRWVSQPQKMSETSTDSNAEGGNRVSQPRRHPPDNSGG